MATLIASKEFVFVSNGLKLLVMDFKRNTYDIHNVRESVSSEDKKIDNENPKILSSELSPCGKLLALADDFKRLSVWETDGMKLKFQTKVERRINRMAFTPDSHKIATADKSGDSYLYDLQNDDKEQLILGHLSMLTGVALSENGSFIITSDRDEKIRVSHFPNGYNILGFCLGHENFVTNFKLLQHDLLISSSGDGSLRLWKYLQGSQVAAAYPFKDININIEEDQQLAVMDLRVVKAETSNSYVIATLEKFPTLVCYEVNETSLKFSSSIELPALAIDISVSSSGLIWTLCKDGLHLLDLDGGSLRFVKEFPHQDLLKRAAGDPFFKDLEGNEDKIEQLRKRLLDNTTEYLKRKEERLGKEAEPIVKKTKL